MRISNEDVYAYIFKKKGISNRVAKELCKLTESFEEILQLDFNRIITDRFSFGVSDSEDDISDILNNNKLCKLNNIVKDIVKNQNSLKEEAIGFYKSVESKGIFWTHITKEDYPRRLLNIPDPPMILYYRGKLPKENVPSVAIVGARECSIYGEKTACMFARELSAAGIQIISGGARGIDGLSQRSSLKVGGKSFSVLGCGVDVVYPKENEDLFEALIDKDGGLISEFEPGTKAITRNFPSRNRIISGLSDIVLVIEARKKSGTYITVCQALEQGREVFAVPGRICDSLSDGCNNLISTGAGVALNPESVINALLETGCMNAMFYSGDNKSLNTKDESFEVNDNNNSASGQDLQSIIIHLLNKESYRISEIQENIKRKISTDELAVILVDMEADGIIKRVGNKYSSNFMNT